LSWYWFKNNITIKIKITETVFYLFIFRILNLFDKNNGFFKKLNNISVFCRIKPANGDKINYKINENRLTVNIDILNGQNVKTIR
jgi:hypothetical protein